MGARGPLKLVPVSAVSGRAGSPVDPGTVAARVRASAPPKPEGLSEDLSAAWDVIVAALDENGLLASCDGPALELALRHYLVARKAADELLGRRARAAVKDPHHDGRLQKNPASQVFRDHSTAFLEFAKQLGMTFVARARTPAREEPGASTSGNPFAAGSG